MATTKRESSLGKEKRSTSCPSNTNSSIAHAQKRALPGSTSCPSNTNSSIAHAQKRPLQGSTENQVPNYLKSKKTSGSYATKNVKKIGAEDTSKTQRPNPLRVRRSFDKPPPVAGLQKAIITPGPVREKTTSIRSASFSSKSTTAPKGTLERVAKKPNAGKPQTLSSSRSSTSMRKTPSPSPTTNTGSTSSASKKPTNTRDKKEAQNLEIKHENKENLDNQVEEEVVKDDEGEMDGIEIPKAEETKHPAVLDSTQVKSVEEVEEGKDTHGHDDISRVSQEHNKVPQSRTEEMEDKFHEEKCDGSNNNQHDEDKENHRHSKEEINVGHDHQEKSPHEESKTETEDGVEEGYTTDQVGATKEIGEEKTDEGSEQERGLESIKKEIAEGEAEESEAEAANLVAKSRVQEAQAAAGHGKKESPTPYNDVIEEKAGKLLEERKNKVRALVGAFENFIDKETSNTK